MTSLLTSVIIVNYNCGMLLTECVHSVLSSTVPVEVFVSDNGSTDGSIEHLKHEISDDRLHVILNRENLGFAKASNIPLQKITSDYTLFLNPDCVIQPDIIEVMEKKMEERPDVGMSGCLILNQDGSEQAGCRRRVPTPWRTLVRILHLDKVFPNHPRFQNIALSKDPLPDTDIELEAISGAFMLVNRKAMEDVGLLDEDYFLHCEDLDWCMRFRQKGWKILFTPDVEITHLKGGCSSGRPVFVEWHKHKGMVHFYHKFFRHQYPSVLMWVVIAAVWVRFLLLSVILTFRRLIG